MVNHVRFKNAFAMLIISDIVLAFTMTATVVMKSAAKMILLFKNSESRIHE